MLSVSYVMFKAQKKKKKKNKKTELITFQTINGKTESWETHF